MVASATGWGSYVVEAKGEVINHKNGYSFAANYLMMVEAYGFWSGGSSKSYSVTFKPDKAGTYTVYTRVSMSNSSDEWWGSPTSGTTDQ